MLGHNSFLIKSNLHTICWINDYVKDTSIGLTKTTTTNAHVENQHLKYSKHLRKNMSWKFKKNISHMYAKVCADFCFESFNQRNSFFFCNISRGNDDNCNENIHIKYVLSVTKHVMLIQRTHTYRSFSGFSFWVLFADLKWKDHHVCWKMKNKTWFWHLSDFSLLFTYGISYSKPCWRKLSEWVWYWIHVWIWSVD